MKYTFELLSEAAAHSTSVAGMLRYLGLKQSGGTQAHVTRRLRVFDIDTSHFGTGPGWNRGVPSSRRKTPDEILVVLPPDSPRPKLNQLKRAMLEVGFVYECSGCGNRGEWCGQPLTLEIDHVDGDWLNNLRDNLRFLCPNCHAQTPTSRSWKHSAG